MENIFEISAIPLCCYYPVKTDFLHIRVHEVSCIQCDLDSIKTFHTAFVSFYSCKVKNCPGVGKGCAATCAATTAHNRGQ